ncbi:MAG: hypothetical protein IH623_24065 [Verrucomicrobia bacterium]|nr:hypothetical protein [Verrucomicrobiota bacterium]
MPSQWPEMSGERIWDYASVFHFGYVAGQPLHMVVACDETRQQAVPVVRRQEAHR